MEVAALAHAVPSCSGGLAAPALRERPVGYLVQKLSAYVERTAVFDVADPQNCMLERI